jgi:DNA helicase IV
VIARTPDAARRWAQALRRSVGVRLALEGDFRFDGGMHFTCVAEVKGLEFDYVIVPMHRRRSTRARMNRAARCTWRSRAPCTR